MAQLPGLTPEQVIADFETKVGDTLDSTQEYILLNDVKDMIEQDDTWAILQALDESETANTGDTYQTYHTLPTDFSLPAPGGIFVGTDIIPYRQIPFEQVIRWKDTTHRYYIDMANNRYALCGVANPGGTIHFYYQKSSPALAAGTAPAQGTPWIFPARFHPILAQLMAEMFPAIDQPDKSRAWDDRWNVFSAKRLETMRRWNAALRLQAHQNDQMPIDISADPNIIDIDADGMGGGSIYG